MAIIGSFDKMGIRIGKAGTGIGKQADYAALFAIHLCLRKAQTIFNLNKKTMKKLTATQSASIIGGPVNAGYDLKTLKKV